LSSLLRSAMLCLTRSAPSSPGRPFKARLVRGRGGGGGRGRA